MMILATAFLCLLQTGCEKQPHHDEIQPHLMSLIEQAMEQTLRTAETSIPSVHQHRHQIHLQLLAANAQHDAEIIAAFQNGHISLDLWQTVLAKAIESYIQRVNRYAPEGEEAGLPYLLDHLITSPAITQEQWILARCWLRQLLIQQGLKAPPNWNFGRDQQS